jgi:hypothetical protein
MTEQTDWLHGTLVQRSRLASPAITFPRNVIIGVHETCRERDKAGRQPALP